MRFRTRLSAVTVYGMLLLLMAPVGQAVEAPPGGHPLIVVDEDFDDETADGFFTGTGALGEIVPDGTGNLVYEISEQQATQAFLPVPAGDFRLTLDTTSLLRCDGDECSLGIPGFLFRADPDGSSGYFMDSEKLFEIGNPTSVATVREEISDWVGMHSYEVSAIGGHIRVFRDGRQILSTFHDGPRQGHIALIEVNGGFVWVDNVKLFTPDNPFVGSWHAYDARDGGVMHLRIGANLHIVGSDTVSTICRVFFGDFLLEMRASTSSFGHIENGNLVSEGAEYFCYPNGPGGRISVGTEFKGTQWPPLVLVADPTNDTLTWELPSGFEFVFYRTGHQGA